MTIKSALFLDFDNVYITLRKDSLDLANRFASKPQIWMRAVEQQLGLADGGEEPARRLLIRRCYASPQTIYQSRFFFTQAGLEVVDCPPLTKRMKNGADISMVMDVMDSILRYPHVEEYILLSADADFVPVLHRLRKEMKRSVIFTSFDTTSAYKNCADLTIDAEFFREHLEAEATDLHRPSAGHAAARAAADRTAFPPEFWEKVEATFRLLAAKRLGHLPHALAANELRMRFPEELGASWAGYPRFSDLMSAAPRFAGFISDPEAKEFRIENFELDLAAWGDAGEGDMVEFVKDVFERDSRIPFLTPDAYAALFAALEKAFADGAETLSEAVAAAVALCREQNHEIGAQDVRFIVHGVSSQGCTLDDTSTAADFASAWRVNVWEMCGEPDWMREPDEAAMLATWFHAPGESLESGIDDFIATTGIEAPDDVSPAQG